jgi:protein-L-isoaspartate O-methyltransferase
VVGPAGCDMRLVAIAACAVCAVAAQSSSEKLAPYYPTPPPVVEQMLKLGRLKAGEKMFDLGSGDGRIVILAARKFKADATGVELDEDLCRQSEARIRKLRLESLVRIIHGDMLKQDYSSADLITVYLLPASNEKIRPILDAQLKKGARIVAHDFEIPDWKPVQVVDIDNDGEGHSRRLYLYEK